MNVLIACEESQEVCKQFRLKGHEAYSNDVIGCSGGHPEWHLQMDSMDAIHYMKWDLVIAFPPCTHLAVSGAKHFEQKRLDGRQQSAIDFFLAFTKLGIPWCIENPVGIMSRVYRKPDQIIQPYYFGDPFQKTTCLWLNWLPLIPHDPRHYVSKGEFVTTPSGKTLPKWYSNNTNPKNRSKTFPGIAKAMANTWG